MHCACSNHCSEYRIRNIQLEVSSTYIQASNPQTVFLLQIYIFYISYFWLWVLPNIIICGLQEMTLDVHSGILNLKIVLTGRSADLSLRGFSLPLQFYRFEYFAFFLSLCFSFGHWPHHSTSPFPFLVITFQGKTEKSCMRILKYPLFGLAPSCSPR